MYLRNLTSNTSPINLSVDKILHKSLSSLDLSENNFQNLFLNNSSIDINYLDMSNLNLNLENLNLDKIFNLISLDLSLNRIENLTYFIDLKSNLQILARFNLSFNLIQRIEENSLKFQNLKILDLGNNKIYFVDKYAFYGLKWLEFVSLSNNNIKSICISYISSSFLKYLSLRNNSINSLYEKKLEEINFIETVDLGFNSIQELDLSLLFENTDLENFKHLFLNNNLIEKIRQSDFAYFTELFELDLSFNQLSSMETHAFRNLGHLNRLNLASNYLKELNSQIFMNLYQIRFLNLSSNYLECLDKNLFSDMKYLIDLDLSNNKLKFIQADLFRSLSRLINLNLDFNLNIKVLNDALNGLYSIENIQLAYNVLSDQTNKINIVNSLRARIGRQLGDLYFYNSINFILVQNITDCDLTLYYIKRKYK